MGDFIQQVFMILTTNPGSLVYNLVLGFSIVAAGLATINQWRANPSKDITPIARRILLGLGLLLVFRLALFLIAALAWQRLVYAELILPVLGRSADLLGLLVITWLWVFPEVNRLADLGFIILGLLVLAITVFGLGWVAVFGPDSVQNGAGIDHIAQLTALLLGAFGLVMLLVRRPVAWPIGLVMLAILSAGHLVQLLAPGPGVYPGAVRLAEIIAYPLLLALPSRLANDPSQN
jgi:hypothetical protein